MSLIVSQSQRSRCKSLALCDTKLTNSPKENTGDGALLCMVAFEAIDTEPGNGSGVPIACLDWHCRVSYKESEGQVL